MEIKTTNYGVCKVKKHKYQTNGNLGLSLVDEDGCPITYISTNILPLAENEFCANIFNIGSTLWNDIATSGLFEKTGEDIQSGFCEYPVCKLLVEIE